MLHQAAMMSQKIIIARSMHTKVMRGQLEQEKRRVEWLQQMAEGEGKRLQQKVERKATAEKKRKTKKQTHDKAEQKQKKQTLEKAEQTEKR